MSTVVAVGGVRPASSAAAVGPADSKQVAALLGTRTEGGAEKVGTVGTRLGKREGEGTGVMVLTEGKRGIEGVVGLRI